MIFLDYFCMLMDLDDRYKRVEKFIGMMTGELALVNASGAVNMQFILMGQAIEVLGALLDNKPMKARGQSANRFDLSVRVLFGGGYRVMNTGFYLYDKLRNQMVHAFIPGGDILLFDKEADAPARHLEKYEGSLVLAADVFYKDICAAGERLLRLIRSGKVPPKNIAF